jgi:hypothetical protein
MPNDTRERPRTCVSLSLTSQLVGFRNKSYVRFVRVLIEGMPPIKTAIVEAFHAAFAGVWSSAPSGA